MIRRHFEAFGHQGSVTRWWPKVPDDFPTPTETVREIEEREGLIPEVQHRLIELEQLRVEIGQLEREADRRLSEAQICLSTEQATLLSRLLGTRRDLLDQLIADYGRYSSQLVELDTVSRNFLARVRNIQEFMYEKLLWVRSVPRPIIPQPLDMADALIWIISPVNRKEAVDAITAISIPGALSLVLLLGVLPGLRPWFRKRLEALADRASQPTPDSFLATLESYLYSLLLAAPLPLTLFVVSRIFLQSDPSVYLAAAGRALYYTSAIAGLIETSRQLLRPKGLAEVHFGWPRNLTRTVYKGLLWPERTFLPLIYAALHFAFAGLNLNTEEYLQVYNNSLGRVLFVMGLLILGLSLSGLFRPRGRSRSAWRRTSICAVPAITLATFIPALLAALGVSCWPIRC